MKKLILLSLLFLGLNSCTQDLTCEDFKNGTFYIPSNNEFPFDTKIIRNGNFQTKTIIDPNGTINNTIYETIEWIDDCAYNIKYDESKTSLTEFQQILNNGNGVSVILTKIESNCFFFKSKLDINGEIQEFEGKICKE